MIGADDIGGVHIKYLHHCHRQLWLYARGIRPERLNATVALGEAVHDTSYPRANPVDLGAAVLDYIDGRHTVHEVKSSSKPSHADRAQVIHYCYRLHQVGIPAEAGILHYPKVRRTTKICYDDTAAEQAIADITTVLAVVTRESSPPRINRGACRGCSYFDYCWSD